MLYPSPPSLLLFQTPVAQEAHSGAVLGRGHALVRRDLQGGLPLTPLPAKEGTPPPGALPGSLGTSERLPTQLPGHREPLKVLEHGSVMMKMLFIKYYYEKLICPVSSGRECLPLGYS